MVDLKKYYKLILAFIIFILMLPVLLNVLNIALDIKHVDSQVHSVIETLGGIIGFLITMLLYKKYKKNSDELDYPFIALAFLGMGTFDLLHAMYQPGNPFVFTHIFSIFSGSIWFGLLILPVKFRKQIRKQSVFKLILLLWLSVILLVVFFPQVLPLMIDGQDFTSTSHIVNVIAGFSFLIGCLVLLKRFRNTGEIDIFLIAVVALIQGVSRFTFPLSHLWDNEWWIWHIFRFSGYIVVFYTLLRNLNKMYVELDDSYKLQQSILDAMPFGLMLVSKEKKVLQINQSAQQLTGYIEDEVLQKDCYESVCPAECDKCPIIDQNEKLENAQKFIKTKQKKLIPVLKTVVPIVIGSQEVLLEGFVDMTERVEAEENLKKNEQKFREIFDTVTNSIFVIDFEEGIIDVNKTAIEQYGYSKEEFLKMTPTDFIHPDYLPEFERFLHDLKTTGTFKGHTIDIRKNGVGFHTDVNGTIVTFNGKPHLLAAVRDVTEIFEANQELKNMMADLERSNKDLEHFAYISSHDLQEPLRKLQNYSEILIKRNRLQLDEKGQKYVDIIGKSAARMQKLIQDLLSISRISSSETHIQKVDLALVVKSVLEKVNHKLKEYKISLTSDDLPVVSGDESQLRTVFYNLFSNAIKFRGPDKPFIHIKCTENNQNWLFEVADNGIGFDMKYVSKIFVIFQKLHRKEEYSGTGVGLTQCKKIIERNGGEISAHSKPGEGTTIQFTLPKNIISIK